MKKKPQSIFSKALIIFFFTLLFSCATHYIKDARKKVIAILSIDFVNKTNSFGSGVVIKSDDNYNYILTAAHIIGDAQIVGIKYQKKFFNAKILKISKSKDLALLRTKQFIEISECEDEIFSEIDLNDDVFAVGYPIAGAMGLMTTKGNISNEKFMCKGLNDSSVSSECLIHTSVIGQGSSGGPLFNKYGKIVGINVQMSSLRPYVSISVKYTEIKKFLQKISVN